MSRNGPEPTGEDDLLRRVAELEAGLRGDARPLPDAPVVAQDWVVAMLEEADDGEVTVAEPRSGSVRGPLAVGDRIGSVRIEAVLGEGGMGLVLRGFDEKLGRPVAVKTVREAGRLAPAARARFRREARLLSRLNHPAICQVYDLVERANADYLLLELVDGETLRAWQERTPPAALRTAVAMRVVEAVAAAHRAGVIHRDLKPDNVMITARGEVKVLDFGLARPAVAASLASGQGVEAAAAVSRPPGPEEGDPSGAQPVEALGSILGFRTDGGTVMGTPAYMSPEQARGEPMHAPTDVFALGIMLHELWAGARPFPEGVMAWVGAGEPRVSLASSLDREQTRLIERMLASEPSARPSAEEVRSRLGWLATRPARRRRWLLAAAAGLLAMFGASRYVIDVRAERNAAVAARGEAEEVVRFLVSMFELAGPDEARGETITAREILGRAGDRLDELAAQPAVHARLAETVGTVYDALGLYADATPHLERALAGRRTLLGAGHPLTLGTQARWSEHELHRGNYEAARTAASELLTAAEASPAGNERDWLIVEALDLRGTAARQLGDLVAAEGDKRRGMALAEQRFGERSVEAAALASGLALVLWDAGRAEEAEPLARSARERFDSLLPAEHPDRLVALNNHGLILTDLGRFDEAAEVRQGEIALLEKVLGPTHPAVGTALDNLALLFARQGRFADAEPLVIRAEAIFRAGGDLHPDLAIPVHNLATIARELGRLDESATRFEEALRIYEHAYGGDNPALCGSLRGFAATRERQGRPDAAVALLARALAIDERAQGATSPALLATLRRLAQVERSRGRHTAATAYARRALAVAEAAYGADDERAASARELLAEVERDAAG